LYASSRTDTEQAVPEDADPLAILLEMREHER